MKKRALSLVLALVLALSLTPAALAYDGQTSRIDRVSASEAQAPALTEIPPTATGWAERVPYEEQLPVPGEQHLYGALIDEEQVYQILNSFRSVYPEGTYWTNETQKYMLSVPVYDEKEGKSHYMVGYGCVAFCYRLSDAAFGSLSARSVYNFTYDDIRVGDILRIDNNQHSVIVLQKFSDHVVLAEGNYRSSVHWDRTLTRAQVMRANYITTRYPSDTPSDPPSRKPSNAKVSTDQTSYSVGETVTIYYSADDAVSYNISLWLGDYGTGTQITSKTGFTSGKATYQTNAPGDYTLYVEAVNNQGTSSASCQFSVSNGEPSNLKLTADRSVFVVGEPFFIAVTADNMTGYNAELWLGEYDTGTRINSEEDFSPDELIRVVLDSTDSYTVYVEAYNDLGKTSATMSVSAGDSADSGRFTDVPPDAYYTDAVDWALSLEVTDGIGGNRFSPDSTVTRGQAVTFLWRAMGKPSPSSSYNPFTDVSDSSYYYQAVLWAVENGITVGMGNMRFDPNGSVTRGQMITFLWRTMGRPDETGQGAWYADAEYWASANSLLSGTAVSYTTNDACPRSDVVYYLWNALA